jgi:uncharacterized protein
MRTIILTSIMMIVAIHAVQAQNARDDRRMMSVTGEAFTYVVPDRATISIGVASDGKTVAEAKQRNDVQLSALLKAVRSAGVDDRDIQTSTLSVQPIYDYKDDNRRLIKYTMSNIVTIRIRDLSKIETVLNKALTEGGNVLNGISFYAENADAVRDSLQVEAIKDARSRAERLARALGVTVLKPITVNISSPGVYPSLMKSYRAYDSIQMEGSSTEVSAGDTRIEAQVSITFEIE